VARNPFQGHTTVHADAILKKSQRWWQKSVSLGFWKCRLSFLWHLV